MQKQNILRYASVKCNNPHPGFKNQLLFENSTIYTKIKDDHSRQEDKRSNIYPKNTRLHTQGSQPSEITKSFFHPILDKQKRKRQPCEMRLKQDEKKNIDSFGPKLLKGNSQKQFRFVGNFVNLKKNQQIKKQKPADYLPVWVRKDLPTKVLNNFVDSDFRPQNNNKNTKQGNGLCVGVQYWNSKQLKSSETQPSTSYIKRTVKTQTDEVNSQIDSKPSQYFRRSFKNAIRKTQTDEQPAKQPQCRMTATFNVDKYERKNQNNDKITLNQTFTTKQSRGLNGNKQNRRITFQRQKRPSQQVIIQRERYTTNLNENRQGKISEGVKPFSNNFNFIPQQQRISDGKRMLLNNEKYYAQKYRKQARLKTQGNNKEPNAYFLNKKLSKGIQLEQTDTSELFHKQINWKKDLLLMQKIGEGTFGKVYKARLRQQSISKLFAIKKVYIDKKYKSRQLQIVQQLNHPEVMKVHNVFVTIKQPSEQYLNIVMDYYEKNLFEIINERGNKEGVTDLLRTKKTIQLQQKVLIYQILKGLSYIHSLKICHRDIKPHNMLVKGFELVLCDFGSAKKLISGQNNLSYICSRCYRAPQLIFGSTTYTTQIDMWSVACVVLQMLHGLPLFIGQNSLDHLLQVIKVVGTPTKQEVLEMNQNYDITEYDLPNIKRKSLTRLFPKADIKLIDLVNKMLVYNPNQRMTAVEALCHPYFDEIRMEQTYSTLKGLLCKEKLDMMYNFSEKEIDLYQRVLQARKRLNKMIIKEKELKESTKSKSIREILTPVWWRNYRNN